MEINIVKEVVQRNTFFAHPDQLLLAMYTDRDEAVRREAVNKIRKLRDQYIPNTEYEAFPKVNNNNNNDVFIYRSILKMGRIVSERLSIIINIRNTTTKTTGKKRLIQDNDYD